jgi:hypothetical protein
MQLRVCQALGRERFLQDQFAALEETERGFGKIYVGYDGRPQRVRACWVVRYERFSRGHVEKCPAVLDLDIGHRSGRCDDGVLPRSPVAGGVDALGCRYPGRV